MELLIPNRVGRLDLGHDGKQIILIVGYGRQSITVPLHPEQAERLAGGLMDVARKVRILTIDQVGGILSPSRGRA